MKDNNESNKTSCYTICEFICIWIVTTIISSLAGHIGGYIAGVRQGGWNIQLIYPPIIGGIVGLFCYPILRFLLRIGSEEKEKGLFISMPFAIMISFLITIMMIKSSMLD